MNSRNPANRFIYAHYHLCDRRTGQRIQAGPRRAYVEGVDGTRSWHVETDKAGKPFKVYREAHT